MQKVFINQIELISYVKDYLKKCKKLEINIASSSFCYFAHWGQTPGIAKLKIKLLGIKYFLTFLKIIILNILGISKLSNYIVLKNNIDNKKFNNLIITNVSKKDFKSDGSCFDPWFQTNSRKTPNTLWFLNCIDNHVPKKFDKNLVIFCRKNNILKYDFVFFIICFFKTLLKFKFSLRKFLHEFSVHSQFSDIISKKILKEINNGNFKKVINSYEAQPFQNTVFKKIKLLNKKIKTIGFFHTALSPMSTSLIYRDGAPDNLLISGKYSKDFLHKYLNWPKKKIKIVPSFRYNKKNVPDMSGFIYLPFNFFNFKKIVEEFENFIKNSEVKSLNHFKIKNHTYANNSKKHLKLIRELERIINLYKDRFHSKNKKKSIIIGATSTIIVALQANVDVVHICEDPIFELYSEKLWKPLKIHKITNNSFIYNLKRKDALVKFSLENNMLQKYCF